jgi:hypothetical protein
MSSLASTPIEKRRRRRFLQMTAGSAAALLLSQSSLARAASPSRPIKSCIGLSMLEAAKLDVGFVAFALSELVSLVCLGGKATVKLATRGGWRGQLMESRGMFHVEHFA